MKCPICARENRPEESWCGACGASMGSGGSMPHALPTGTELAGGSYTVVHALAQGGFGITYQCIDNRLKIPVAVKEFFPMGCGRSGQSVLPTGGWTRGTYADGRTRFLQEAETLAKFDHPGIVRVRAAFEENDTAYFVMEFLRGRTLAEVLVARNAPFEEGAVVAYLDRMAQALEVVHGAGLLHRDLKPSNVIVTDDGRVVLIDFGTAREYASELSQSHSTVLTAGYAPLEQYSRHGQRGPATDIYALAATGWHLLTGAPPPAATDRAVGIPLPSLRRICPGASETLAVAFERGLEMVPGQRPQSVVEFRQMLRGQSGQVAVGAASGSGHSASVQARVEQGISILLTPPAPPTLVPATVEQALAPTLLVTPASSEPSPVEPSSFERSTAHFPQPLQGALKRWLPAMLLCALVVGGFSFLFGLGDNRGSSPGARTPQTEEIVAQASSTETARVTPEPDAERKASNGQFSYSLIIDSNPMGAEVWVDGRLAFGVDSDSTPMRVWLEPDAKHMIEIKKEGYETYVFSKRVGKNKVYSVNVILRRVAEQAQPAQSFADKGSRRANNRKGAHGND